MLISSRENPRIKLLAKLLSSKRARNETGLFVIEGIRGCCDALSSAMTGDGIEVEAVYYVPEMTENQKEHFPVELIQRLEEKKRFEISRDIAARISDAESAQGIFVTAKKLDRPLTPESIDAGGKYLVLDALQDPGNLGTVIRTADAVGLNGIILTGNCVELYNPKVVRSAVGSLPRVRIFIENDRTAVLKMLSAKGVRTAAAVVSGGEDITGFDFSGGCAAVIGNEGRGLSRETADMCSDRITIAMHGNIDSLNAATAAAIILWEMTRGECHG